MENIEHCPSDEAISPDPAIDVDTSVDWAEPTIALPSHADMGLDCGMGTTGSGVRPGHQP